MIEFALALALAQAVEAGSTQIIRVLRRTEVAAGVDLRAYRAFEVSTREAGPGTTDSINRYLAAIRPPFVHCTIDDRALRLGRFLVLVPSDTQPPPTSARSWQIVPIGNSDLARRYLEACSEGVR